MPYFFPIYNATAIAKAKPELAAPTGLPAASKYTALLAGNVQNTSNVLPVKFTAASELELVMTSVRARFALVASKVPLPTSQLLVPSSYAA